MKNQNFIGKVLDYTHEGSGVLKYDDKVIFTPNVLVGEEVEVKIIKDKKHYGFGLCMEVKEASSNREVPPCPIYKQCGGCQLQHMNIEEANRFKTKRVKDTLAKIAGVEVDVPNVLQLETPYYYRNKAQVPVGGKKHNIEFGFYRKNSNDIIPFEECLIQNKAINRVLNELKPILNNFNVEPYNKFTNKGLLRHILIKHGKATNEIMVVFIINAKSFPRQDQLIAEVKKIKNVKTIILNHNRTRENVILGKNNTIVFGDGTISDYLNDIKFNISTHSFYQVNPLQTKVLYDKAIELAGLSKNDRVLDAYCGIGTISLFLAKHVKVVYGVEIVEQAIIDARENAQINNISNVTFECQDAGAYLAALNNDGIKLDVVFVDPPRKGLEQAFIDALVDTKPKKIVYISCDVSTQARDIKKLIEQGYKIDAVQPVDMFAQTYHVENIVVLSK